MTVPSGKSAEVLRYDSQEYERHADVIQKMADRTMDLSWINPYTNSVIFGKDGVLCDRVSGDQETSVSSLYFKCARNLQNREATLSKDHPIPILLQEQRELVESVLALRMSIIHETAFPPDPSDPLTPFETYRDLIQELELYCKQHGIPSLLPNLFLPSSLKGYLHSEKAYASDDAAMRSMLEKLGMLCAHSMKHLHVVIHFLVKQKQFTKALSLLSEASELLGKPVLEMCQDNVALMEAYIEALFHVGEFEKIVEEMMRLPQIVHSRPILMDQYIRSLIETQRADDFVTFTHSAAAKVAMRIPTLRSLMVKACVDLGWILYGKGNYEEILEVIERLASMDAQITHNNDIQSLIEQAKAMLALDVSQ